MQTFDAGGNPCRPPTRGEAAREWGHILSLPLCGVLAVVGMWLILQSLIVPFASPSTPDSPMASSVSAMTTPVPDTLAVVPFPTLVFFQEVPTATHAPTPPSTHVPLVVALTVVAEHWTPTPDITACPLDPTTLPSGVRCKWPDAAPPTPTPYPKCQTPIPGAVCQPRGSWVPPVPTPTASPAIDLGK